MSGNLGTLRKADDCRSGANESGQVTAFVAVLISGLLLFAGIVFDGGMALAAKTRALDDAQEAARTGAQQVAAAWLRDRVGPVLDVRQAQNAAESYLARVGAQGTVTVLGDRVTVTVTRHQPTQILGLVGITDLKVTATASARARQGVSVPDAVTP